MAFVLAAVPSLAYAAWGTLGLSGGFLAGWWVKGLMRENETLRGIAAHNTLLETRLAELAEPGQKKAGESSSPSNVTGGDLNEKNSNIKEMDRLLKEVEDATGLAHCPTDLEVAAVKEKLGYSDQHANVAVTGARGCGKSSLLNALRGLEDGDEGAAATGVTETTFHTTRYTDPEAPSLETQSPGSTYQALEL